MAEKYTLDSERLSHEDSAVQEKMAHAVSLGFQLSYVLRLGLAIFLGSVAAGAIVYVLLAETLGNYGQSITIISETRESVLGAALLSGLAQVTFTGLIVIVLALFASHKVAGPATRVVRSFRELAKGQLPGPAKFRKGDQVGKLESQFNRVSQMLFQRHESLVQSVKEIEQAEQELRQALFTSKGREAWQPAAQQLHERTNVLVESLIGYGFNSKNHIVS